jgi:putative membrane protein
LNQPSRSLKDYLFILLKGLCMGAADVVPGVSGGTIAFITGIYDEWLDSLKRCTPAVLLRLKREGLVKTWHYINGNFLVAVFGGILISLKTFAALITVALVAYPILVWAFFTGLILASIYLLAKQQRGWGLKHWGALLIGTALVLGISLSAPAQLPGYWWVLFLGGFVAICAMILPGISGSFILLLVGLYPVFLNAINTLDIVALASFGAGCICGLVIFSRFLSWLLSAYHSMTLATLIGFLVGSLYVTWPWKEVLQTTINRHGETIVLQQASISPTHFAQITGGDAMLVAAVMAAIGGVLLVVVTELVAARLKK